MKNLLFSIIIFVALSNCTLNRQYTTINLRSVERTDCLKNQSCYYYKGNKLNGTYKIKHKYGEYSITQFKDGLKHGENRRYDNASLKRLENYKLGLWHGDMVYYSNGQKVREITFRNGFVNGDYVWYNEDASDTSMVSFYYADSLKMDVYIDKMTSLFNNEPLDLLVETCLIKTNKYPIRYYLKTDSSLVAEKIWYRIDDCVYQSKEWGYTGGVTN